ncbi:MAG: hypothetical protein ACI83W_000403 [Marinoscillum sp.]|jgi:hypothetical protein
MIKIKRTYRLKHTLGLIRVVQITMILGALIGVGIVGFIPTDNPVYISNPYLKVVKKSGESKIGIQNNYSELVTSRNGAPGLLLSNGKIDIKTPLTTPWRLGLILAILSTVGFFLLISGYMHRIISDIRLGQAFNDANIRRLKSIGRLVMLAPIVEWLILTSMSIWLSISYDFEGLSPDYDNELGWTVFLLGLLIYSLGSAFEQGKNIAEENQLTI